MKTTKRHEIFNLIMIGVPWFSLLFFGKRSLKRYSWAGIFIIIFEVLNHLYGRKQHWWKFYEIRKSFIRDEIPFSLGPYMPLSMWILKYSYGNFKKFVLLNVLADGTFAFFLTEIMKKFRIARLKRLNSLQFFIYLHYKAYLLYGFQYLVEKIRRDQQRLPEAD